MEFCELEAFVTVADERSFSRAALRLSRTQPAISQAIRRLEERLGDRLFDRSSKVSELTDAGRLLLEYAQRVLQLRWEAGAAVRDLKKLQGGGIRIGADETIIPTLLSVIAVYQTSHPDVHVEVRRMPERQMMIDLGRRVIDCAAVGERPQESWVRSVSIGTDQWVVVAGQRHPLTALDQVSVADLVKHRVVLHCEGSPSEAWATRLLEQHGMDVLSKLILPSIDAVKQAVGQGMGVGLLPTSCTRREIARGELLVLPVVGLSLARELYMIHRDVAQHSHAAEAFLEVARRWRDQRRNSSSVSLLVGSDGGERRATLRTDSQDSRRNRPVSVGWDPPVTQRQAEKPVRRGDRALTPSRRPASGTATGGRRSSGAPA